MAKGTRGRRGASRRCRLTPYPLPSHADTFHKNYSRICKKDWEDAMCSVCMECPHNAVLLLCSSHEKGCRPYMCGTSFRHSNCLDQYKKAYKKVTSRDLLHDSLESQFIDKNCEPMELACPLCRGQVKGWTIVEPAREHLNAKKRSCMQDNCSFTGTYKELRKHVKSEHPDAKPREVDPALEQNWRGMERERERDDVLSTIRSSMPGAMFFGDYVIEGVNRYDFDWEDEDGLFLNGTERDTRIEAARHQNLMSVFLLLETLGSSANVGSRQHERNSNRLADRGPLRWSRESYLEDSDQDSGDDDNNDNDDGGGNLGTSLAARSRRQGRVAFRSSERW